MRSVETNICPQCGGSGEVQRFAGDHPVVKSVKEPCPECGGTGEKEDSVERTEAREYVEKVLELPTKKDPCDKCGGSGEVGTKPCPECGGKGECLGPNGYQYAVRSCPTCHGDRYGGVGDGLF